MIVSACHARMMRLYTTCIQQPPDDTHLEEVEEVQSQIESLSSKLEEKDREILFQERQLKEMKNMNAALENQLTEYMDALEHQNKVITSNRGLHVFMI